MGKRVMVRLTIVTALALSACSSEPDRAAGTEDPVAPAASPAEGDDAARILTAMPDDFIGRWDFSEETCADPASEMRLEIAADEIRYYESSAVPSRITAESETSLTVEHLFSGEGEEWNETLAYELSADGERLTVTQADGSMSIRMRCA